MSESAFKKVVEQTKSIEAELNAYKAAVPLTEAGKL
jgi:hypothetical protein